MKNRCKRLTALVLVLSMCFSLLSATAWATDIDIEAEDEITAEVVPESSDDEEVEQEEDLGQEEDLEEEETEREDEDAVEEFSSSKEVSADNSTSEEEAVSALDDVTLNIVIEEDQTLSDTTLTGNVYIKQDVTLNTTGTVEITGNIYVFGTLENTGTLTVSGALYCLHYGSMLSAGDYDYGYVNNSGTLSADSLIVKDDYLAEGIPESSEDTSGGETSQDSDSLTAISTCTVSLSATSYTYDGTAKKPTVTVKDGSTTLTNGTDYTVAYSNNTNAGTATVTVTGIGNYTGSVSKTFKISKASQALTASAAATSIYAGKTTTITASTTGDGAISYTSSDTSIATVSSKGVVTGKKPGTVTITVKAAGNSNYNAATKTVKITVKLNKTTISSLTNTASGITVKWSKVTGASGYYVYRNGTQVKKITSGSTVSYSDTGAKTNGTKYQYKIYAYYGSTKSAASATETTYYVSRPTISSLKVSASTKLTVKWSKNKKATGYQIQYSTSSDFSSYKSVSVSSYKTVSKTISSLTKGTKYYVRVRGYKTVSGTKYYSAWSSSKSAQLPDISKTKATLVVGETLTLKMTGTTKTVKWSSSKKSVATVSSSGKVTAKKKGTATITAKVGGISYTCKITVEKKTLSVSKSSISISSTGTVTVSLNGDGYVTYTIADPTIVSCEWSDWDDNKIDLTIVGKKAGSTKITITNSINSQKCVITVTVKKAATYAQGKYVMAAYAIDCAYNNAKYPSTLHIYGMTYQSSLENNYGDTIDRLVLRCYAMNGLGGYSDFYVVVLRLVDGDVSNYNNPISYDDYYLITSTYNSSPGMSGTWLDNATALKAYQYVFDTTREIEYD